MITLQVQSTIAVGVIIAESIHTKIPVAIMERKKSENKRLGVEIMYINIQCSNCGAHRRISNKDIKYTLNAIRDGWGSFGDVTYCPKCTATWTKRNGYDRPLAGDEHTFMLIMDKFMREIRYREEAAKRRD